MEASNYDALEELIEEIHKELQKEFGSPKEISQSQMRKLKKWDRHPDHYWFYDTPNRLKLYFRVDGPNDYYSREEAIQWQ